jgi:endonuclease/exonuclease/phosphatase family metal-dependent hydrolase
VIGEKQQVTPREEGDASPLGRPLLRVMTLNIAHGRKDRVHQSFLKRRTIEDNLDDIARVLVREKPLMAALQEADGASAWSGGFDHVGYLAQAGGFRYSVRGEHVKGAGLCYGTAFVSSVALADVVSVTFPSSPPTFSKGFVVCTVTEDDAGAAIDVVSVHLDFSRDAVRETQLRMLVEELSARARPLIVMGDFNCQWNDDASPLRLLAEGLGLRAFEPDTDMPTFPTLGARLDWILVSREFEFVRYEVVPDTVSDHLGVVADIRMSTE